MTNLEVIQLGLVIDDILNTNSKEAVKPFEYAFVRNKVRIAKVLTERDAIISMLRDNYEKENPIPEVLEEGFPEKYQAGFSKYLEETGDWENFLKEESGMQVFTVGLEKLENAEIDMDIISKLLGTLLVE